MTKPLRENRDFRLLWLSGLFAVLGGQMSALALPLLVLKETGSAVQAGAVGTVSVGAVLITMLPGGVMADRIERRRLMRLCDVGSLTVVTALTIAVFYGHAPMPLVLLVAAAGAVISSVYAPAVFGLMRAVVPADQMGTATARLQARTQTARLVGPLVGGALFGIHPALPFAIEALGLLASTVCVALVRTRSRARTTAGSAFSKRGARRRPRRHLPLHGHRGPPVLQRGGIYLAKDRETGRRVVLREARPHCGLDGAGDDAVTRLHREHRALTTLAGLDCVPEVHGVRTVWEHHFLIEEHIEGNTLLEEIVGRFALVRGAVTAEELAPYVAWTDAMVGELSRALEEIHARGLRFGDLHPSNIIVRPDGRIALVDFEYATALDDHDTPLAGAQGLQAPPGTPGAEADAYALWATWLTMLMPLTEMAGLERAKALTLESWARRRYGLPAGAGPARPALLHGLDASRRREAEVAALFEPEVDWAEIRTRLLAGIHAGATPERTDRLFPGGPGLFATGGTDLANGAAGVLYALHRTGAPVPGEWTDWLAAAALRRDPAEAGGLFDGLPGTALVLTLLGRAEQGRELWDRAMSTASPAPSADLFTGRAGIALAALRMARASYGPEPGTRLIDTALSTARDLDLLARGEEVDGMRLPESAGLLRGLSGAALLHLELHALTGEDWLREAARTAIEREAGHLVTLDDGTLQVRDGGRNLLYLNQGSSGVALVAQAYTARHEDPALGALIPGVRKGCAMEFVREPGLFMGRAGLVASAGQLAPDGRTGTEVLASVRNLTWHLLADEDRLLVPGATLRRCSADLATGAAGLLLSLDFLSGATDATAKSGLLDLLTLG
ncbi:Enterobactin exporter EntS [Streptomyces microflavus]